jgi:hypothetical protein
MEVYGGNQRSYSSVIAERYRGVDLASAIRPARDHESIRNDVEFVFPNLRPTHRQIGIALEGMPVWTREPSFRLTTVPEPLRGDVVVDASAIPLERSSLFVESLARVQTAELDKLDWHPRPGSMAILTRSDLRILLFAEASEAAKLRSDVIAETDHRIALRNGAVTIELTGLEVRNYFELHVRDLRGRYFFVIAPALR